MKTFTVIPPEWYQTVTITTPGGTTKADLLAIIILARVVNDGKYEGGYQSLANLFNVSKRQIVDACHRLKKAGFITLEFSTVATDYGLINNIPCMTPISDAVTAAPKGTN